MSQKGQREKWNRIRYRLFRMVSVGVVDDPLSFGYDLAGTAALLTNLFAAFAVTFDSLFLRFGPQLKAVESATVVFFALDYILRLLTAKYLYPGYSEKKAAARYAVSGEGIIDLLSFLPHYLPFFFPAGAAAFRLFRIARIFRLFRINAYYDSLNVITEVIISKKNQLLSSVFLLSILMMASSLCMYSLEHEAQPEVFQNAFSGIWWSVSTLLTVGYGDIYPVTTLGKAFGILISCLGVGMVAIPTGIISAGFVEQYSRLKRIGDYGAEEDIHFIELRLSRRDQWAGRPIRDLGLPHGAIVAMVERRGETLIPRGDVVLQAGDKLVIAAEAIKHDQPISLKEVLLKRNHSWVGKRIQDLDISRQSFIILVKRHESAIIPRGDLVLNAGDTLILYNKVTLDGTVDMEGI